MRKHKITITTANLIIIFSFLLFSTIAYAQTDPPMLPAFFYGKATVNGEDVEVNSIIIAKIDGEKRGEITVNNAGEYGSTETDNKLAVTGSNVDSAKDIEFYVKIPEFQEIKATQTFQWLSGSINSLDLTFIGDQVPEPEGSSRSSSSSSSGGDGGSGGGTTGGGGGSTAATTNSVSFYYTLIEADKQVSRTISNPNIPIVRFQLIVNNDVTDVNFNFEVIDSVNVKKLDDVYKYISINAPKIIDDNVKIAILRFKIPNDWFENNNYDPEKVSLLRFNNNQWNELETIHEGSDNEYNLYRAQTPGFSYFAIKSEKSSVVKQKTLSLSGAESTDEEDQEENKITGITGLAIGGGKANPVVGFSIFFVILILGLALILFFKDKIKGMV